MTLRIRRLATVTAAGLAIAAPAGAVPSTPILDPAPVYAQGTTASPSWTPSTFAAMSADRGYEIEVADSGGGFSWRVLPGGALTQHTLTGLNDGLFYTVRVRARERECLVPVFRSCPAWSPAFSQSPWSPPVVFRVDATAPTGTLTIDGGTAYTTDLDLDLAHTATDPIVAGPASGMAWLEVSQGCKFTCESEGADECPQPFAAATVLRLADGEDGERTVQVRYRDAAVPYAPDDGAPTGNSVLVTDTIVLDRVAPEVALGFPTRRTVRAGIPVTYSVSGISDATSGVDPASVTWHFGVPGVPSGSSVSHTYALPGTYQGSVEVPDRAGNVSVRTFTVTVL